MDRKIRIAVDGPSGSGKSTLAKGLAREMGLVYVDTGALYRAVGLFVKRAGIDPAHPSQLQGLLGEIRLELRYTKEGQRVILCGEDVSDLLRTPEISMYASAVAANRSVRQLLLEMQKRLASEGNVVMDGRDIGTVIMPDADVKLFLEPSFAVRAARRYQELIEKGENVTREQVLEDMIRRDKNDSGREIAPAVPADDAIFLDNSEMDQAGTVAAAMQIIREKLKRSHPQG